MWNRLNADITYIPHFKIFVEKGSLFIIYCIANSFLQCVVFVMFFVYVTLCSYTLYLCCCFVFFGWLLCRGVLKYSYSYIISGISKHKE